MPMLDDIILYSFIGVLYAGYVFQKITTGNSEPSKQTSSYP